MDAARAKCAGGTAGWRLRRGRGAGAFLSLEIGDEVCRCPRRIPDSFDEFEVALKMMQIPFFNVMYADKEGNIFYMFNG